MSEWKEYNITEVCDTISDTYKDGAEHVVLINTSDVLEGEVTNHELVLNKNLAGQFKKKFKKDDILYSEIRPANRRYAYVDFEPKDYIASTKLMVLRSKSCILPKYLYYLLTSNSTIRELHAIAVGRSGTFPQITYSELANIKFLLPSVEEQGKILSILLELDNKIAINRRICENLEAQAQALFKHWFIDFAPFKDGKFVESELGMIPEGWRVGRLAELGKIICGKTPSKANKSYYGGDVPFIKIPDMHGRTFVLNSEDSLTEEGSKSQFSKLIPAFSIMVSCIATVGLVSMNIKPAQTNQQINTVVPNEPCYRYYIYENVKLRDKELLMLGSSGTTTFNVNTKTFSSLKILIPDTKVIEIFNNIVKCHYEEVLNLYQESLRLSTLRDTLLPKLMSGQIKL